MVDVGNEFVKAGAEREPRDLSRGRVVQGFDAVRYAPPNPGRPFGEPRRFFSAAVSDFPGRNYAVGMGGKRLVLKQRLAEPPAMEIDANGRRDIWVYQIATRTPTRITTDGINSNPLWSADGRSIQFLSTRAGRTALLRQSLDFSADPEPILSGIQGLEWGAALSPDQRHVLRQSSSGATISLVVTTLGAGSPRSFVSGNFNAWGARFSPSGRSVAYASDESRRTEVYVRSFPGPGARVQISAGGGSEPVWSRDGRSLYYAAGNQMTRATLTPEPNVSVVARDSLFSAPFFGTYLTYDVAPDGWLLVLTSSSDEHFQLVAALDWTSGLAARLASP